MAQVNVTIDGKVAHVEQGSTILQAAQSVDIKIPTLCYLNLHAPGSSRWRTAGQRWCRSG